MTWNPLRITSVWVKVAYIVAWWASGALLFNFVFARTPEWILSPLALLWDAAWLVVGTRSFRAAQEPIAPPRPWWQATGRPKASFWLGVLATVAALSFLSGITRTPELAFTSTVFTVEYAIIAAFYFQSGLRLKSNPRVPQLGDPLPKARAKKLDLR